MTTREEMVGRIREALRIDTEILQGIAELEAADHELREVARRYLARHERLEDSPPAEAEPTAGPDATDPVPAAFVVIAPLVDAAPIVITLDEPDELDEPTEPTEPTEDLVVVVDPAETTDADEPAETEATEEADPVVVEADPVVDEAEPAVEAAAVPAPVAEGPEPTPAIDPVADPIPIPARRAEPSVNRALFAQVERLTNDSRALTARVRAYRIWLIVLSVLLVAVAGLAVAVSIAQWR